MLCVLAAHGRGFSVPDAEGAPFDGAKTYKVTLPKDVPARAFWSFTLYDNRTRSMLQTPQKYPRAGSQSYPSPSAEAAADGTTTVYFGPTQPRPQEGLVHDPAPLQPAALILRQDLAAKRNRSGEVNASATRKMAWSAFLKPDRLCPAPNRTVRRLKQMGRRPHAVFVCASE